MSKRDIEPIHMSKGELKSAAIVRYVIEHEWDDPHIFYDVSVDLRAATLDEMVEVFRVLLQTALKEDPNEA